jgi:outer membrane protein assembly factor BamE (lipoprotein component of BamABCDE complex)
MKSLTAISFIAFLLSLGGCKTTEEHLKAVSSADNSNLTVGVVQRRVRVGMSGADVIAALGSPNIVSKDDNANEVWVYDRISSQKVYSSSSGGVSTLFIGVANAFGGGAMPSYREGSGASTTSQKTLTIAIKFDSLGKVSSFSYHTSRF